MRAGTTVSVLPLASLIFLLSHFPASYFLNHFLTVTGNTEAADLPWALPRFMVSNSERCVMNTALLALVRGGLDLTRAWFSIPAIKNALVQSYVNIYKISVTSMNIYNNYIRSIIIMGYGYWSVMSLVTDAYVFLCNDLLNI